MRAQPSESQSSGRVYPLSSRKARYSEQVMRRVARRKGWRKTVWRGVSLSKQKLSISGRAGSGAKPIWVRPGLKVIHSSGGAMVSFEEDVGMVS